MDDSIMMIEHSLTISQSIYHNRLKHTHTLNVLSNAILSLSNSYRIPFLYRPELEHTDGLHRLLFDIYLPFKKTSFKGKYDSSNANL